MMYISNTLLHHPLLHPFIEPTLFYVFAAIRLSVLEEPESDEEVIFNKKPQPQKTGWSLDAEGSDLEDKPHNRGRRHKSKVVESAQSEVAFSSPLVRRLAKRKRRPATPASLGRLLLLPLSFVLKSQRNRFILSRMRKHVNSIWLTAQEGKYASLSRPPGAQISRLQGNRRLPR